MLWRRCLLSEESVDHSQLERLSVQREISGIGRPSENQPQNFWRHEKEYIDFGGRHLTEPGQAKVKFFHSKRCLILRQTVEIDLVAILYFCPACSD
jgi:hypothetical protein